MRNNAADRRARTHRANIISAGSAARASRNCGNPNVIWGSGQLSERGIREDQLQQQQGQSRDKEPGQDLSIAHEV